MTTMLSHVALCSFVCTPSRPRTSLEPFTVHHGEQSSQRRLYIAILAAVASATCNGFGFYAPSASIHSSNASRITGKRSHRQQQLELYAGGNNDNINTKSQSNNLLSTVLATAITTATLFSPLASHSADYGSFTPKHTS